MNKSTSKTTSYVKLGLTIFVVIIASAFVLDYTGLLGGKTTLSIDNTITDQNVCIASGGTWNSVTRLCAKETGSSASRCPTTLQTTFNLSFKNIEDTTTDSTISGTAYLIGSKGDYQSMTSSGATKTLNCDETYTLNFVSSDGNNGVNAKITGIEQGPGAVLNSDGTVTFTPIGNNYYLKADGSDHGVLQVKPFDIDGNAFVYPKEGSPTQGDYELTGTTFVKDSSNTTFTLSTTDPEQQFKIFFRVNQTDTRFDDFGYWILIDLNSSVFNEPTVKVNGVLLSDQKGQFNTYENRQFGSTYEYAYKLDNKVVDTDNELYIDVRALDGVEVGSGDDMATTFQSIGAYKATSSNTVKYGLTKDDSTATKVFTSQTFTFDFS